MKRVAILQSSYIPWKGVFDIINQVDEFILFDDVQFTKRDWRNRNQIKTGNGPLWLTIPVEVSGKYLQNIKDVEISDSRWNSKHWASINHAYAKAPHFSSMKARISELMLTSTQKKLSEVNYHLTSGIMDILNIKTKLSWSMDYNVTSEDPTDRLVLLCMAAKATSYLSGPSAKNYIRPEAFSNAGIQLQYMDYTGYPEYGQLHPPFSHYVSIIDLLVHCGDKAADYIWGWRAT